MHYFDLRSLFNNIDWHDQNLTSAHAPEGHQMPLGNMVWFPRRSGIAQP
jgi:hypothetical protein